MNPDRTIDNAGHAVQATHRLELNHPGELYERLHLATTLEQDRT